MPFYVSGLKTWLICDQDSRAARAFMDTVGVKANDSGVTPQQGERCCIIALAGGYTGRVFLCYVSPIKYLIQFQSTRRLHRQARCPKELVDYLFGHRIFVFLAMPSEAVFLPRSRAFP